MTKFFNYLFHSPNDLFIAFLVRIAPIIPDKLYIKWMFRLKMGYKLNLNNPQTFNEKIQWLKLYNRKPEYPKMVDKYEVKQIVANIIGEEYIIPTLGVWNTFEEINFDSLPNQFVLKTTNGGGGTGVVICRDKSSFNINNANKILNKALKNSIYRKLREWPYKNIKPRIIAEKYIVDSSGELNDFKFSCFDGNATDVMICTDRASEDTKFYFFDKDWKLLKYNKRGMIAPEGFSLPRPQNLDEMFKLASKLSTGIPYLRVDLYNVDGKIYFGENTFYPASGFDPNLLIETDLLFGSQIIIK